METVTYDETKWKLVPVDPPFEMFDVFDENGLVSGLCARRDRFNHLWGKALAIAPQPPTEPSGWQPIKTAPRETELLIGRYVGDEWHICQSGLYYDDDGVESLGHEPGYWYWHCDFDSSGVTDDTGPTHWMPLPPAPEKK